MSAPEIQPDENLTVPSGLRMIDVPEFYVTSAIIQATPVDVSIIFGRAIPAIDQSGRHTQFAQIRQTCLISMSLVAAKALLTALSDVVAQSEKDESIGHPAKSDAG